MSLDSPYDQMERHIAYGTGIYTVIITWLLIIQGPLSGWLAPLEDTIENLDLLALPTLTAIAFAIGYFLKYVGMHGWFDKKAFGARDEVGKFIADRLRRYFEKRFKDRNQCVDPTDYQLISVFYEFTNKQEGSWAIQRALAFSYWLKYYLSMNLIVLSIFGIAAVFLVDLIGYFFASYTLTLSSILTIEFFCAVWIISALISQNKLRPELTRNIANPQLDRIVLDNGEQLDAILKNRFTKDNEGLY